MDNLDLSDYKRTTVVRWRIAHRAPMLYLTYAVWLACNYYLLDMPLPVEAVAALGYFTMAFCEVGHSRKLCGLCAAMTPLDGAADAQRNNRWLRAYHGYATEIVLASIGVTCMAIGWLLDLKWLAQVFPVLIFVVAAHATRARQMHGLLQPWCRYCHEHDDDDETAPSGPTPPGGTGVHG